ncbi:class I tRNA ligase family protein [Candidatus Poribacteria bacterium]|nr:class I tRNA ligase family protein [Candidatus Poribacteria bacterium]
MKKAKNPTRNSKENPSKSNTRKKTDSVKTPKPSFEYRLESDIVRFWSEQNVYLNKENTSDELTCVIREMPTPVSTFSFDTLKGKIYQDTYLKYELMQGNSVKYTPLWETFPFNIETIVIRENKTTANMSNFRKQCRQVFSQHLKSQQEKFINLGIFADWTAAEKSLDTRYEAKIFSHFDRLREYSFLRDELRLSDWCPNCILPLESGKTVNTVSTSELFTYVKFPLNIGFEDFGKNVYFTIQVIQNQLWEVAGTIALGITNDVTYWLTHYQDDYLIFAEPHLKKFVGRSTKPKDCPTPVAKIDVEKLKECSLTHPLYSLNEVPIVSIPEGMIPKIAEYDNRRELESGIIPINPSHHTLSYYILKSLDEFQETELNRFVHSTSTAPVFDENGRFTEDADTLCGLYLPQVTPFITDEFDAKGLLIKTRKQKAKQHQCQICEGSSVSRPYRHWVFSFLGSEIKDEVTNSTEYWQHYDENLRNLIYAEIINVDELPVSSERQWGIPLPILRCDNCNELLSDKKILRSVRSSIRRGAEQWFRLSVEEILPAETVCESCNFREFRKESTYIQSNFANLLQALDASDYKNTAHESVGSIAFVPETKFIKWVGQLSILSAALQQSRPTKDSQPYKNLHLIPLSGVSSDSEIQESFIEKYPADVVRIVSISGDLQNTTSDEEDSELLESHIKKYNRKYIQLKKVLTNTIDVCMKVDDSQNTKRRRRKSFNPNTFKIGELNETDLLAISKVNNTISSIDIAYKTKEFHTIFNLLSDLCLKELDQYIQLSQKTLTKKNFQSLQSSITAILKVVIQRLAPIAPFLAEDLNTAVFTSSKSIFEEKWVELPQTNWNDDMVKEWKTLISKKL